MTETELVPITLEHVTIGVDPGSRNTAVSVRLGNEVLYSSTIKRADDTEPEEWARESVDHVINEVLPLFPNYQIGVEKATPPQSHMSGKKSILNPKYTIWLALVVGGFVVAFRDAAIVRPGKNGSQPMDSYPDAIKGRRPKDLPGRNNAGTRDHERSAYDVAGVAEQLHRERRTQNRRTQTGVPATTSKENTK